MSVLPPVCLLRRVFFPAPLSVYPSVSDSEAECQGMLGYVHLLPRSDIDEFTIVLDSCVFVFITRVNCTFLFF